MEIDIEIENPRDFTVVAYVLDYENILQCIAECRDAWTSGKLIQYDRYDNWINEYHPELIYTKNTAQQLEEILERHHIDKLNNELDETVLLLRDKELGTLSVFEYESDNLLRKIGLPAIWKKLIQKAVLTNKVNSKDWEELRSSNESYYYNDWLFSIDKFAKPRIYNGETKSAIKLHREWYWLNHKTNPNRLGLRKLSSSYQVPIATIKDAIDSYNTFLYY